MNIKNPLETTKEKLLPLLKENFRENLKSVIVYGSAVSDNFNPESSDINVLVILEKIDTASLALFGKKKARQL
jgi:predicted nucleotidyltransferase